MKSYGVPIDPFVPQPSSAYPRRHVEATKEPHFPPVTNGLDYLVSVVELLEGKGEDASARDLKYAVLHLAAGAEVLLKARLQREHWSLVFAHPGQATREALEDGSLISCGPEETRQRLTSIVGITFAKREKVALTELSHSRNALMHYGLVGTRANARTIASTTAEVLNFLVPFVEEHILYELDPPELDIAVQEMARIRGGLRHIAGYVEERLKDLAPLLGPARSRTVQCPACTQWALVVSPHDEVRTGVYRAPDVKCLFCDLVMTADEAADEYASVILGARRDVIYECTKCADELLVTSVETAAVRGRLVDFCFGCTTVFHSSQQCQRCGALTRPGEVHHCPFTRARTTSAAAAKRGLPAGG
ncbi:hypothetical protein [Streptomyces sp. NPDC051000]|uniref:hypothetical protein n=1 Tax=Streptomyces sp. NPDC051000 TaxID=3155520 RepID=UPI0033F383D6